jgi:hypothetical protein
MRWRFDTLLIEAEPLACTFISIKICTTRRKRQLCEKTAVWMSWANFKNTCGKLLHSEELKLNAVSRPLLSGSTPSVDISREDVLPRDGPTVDRCGERSPHLLEVSTGVSLKDLCAQQQIHTVYPPFFASGLKKPPRSAVWRNMGQLQRKSSQP